MAADDLPADELIDLLIEKGPLLRKAGVLVLVLGGVRVELAPAEPPEVKPARGSGEIKDDEFDEEGEDPFDDPATYGRRSSVPGFKRPGGARRRARARGEDPDEVAGDGAGGFES